MDLYRRGEGVEDEGVMFGAGSMELGVRGSGFGARFVGLYVTNKAIQYH